MIDINSDLDITSGTMEITRRSKDSSDIKAKEGEVVRAFLGPASRKNQALLENYGIIGANSQFNPHIGIAASWSFQGFVRFEGRLEVTRIGYKDGRPELIEFTFYGKQRSLATIFGGMRLSDLDWSTFDHELTYDYVVESWGFTFDLLYPLVDTKKNYYFGPEDQDVPGNIRNSNHPILLTDLRPAIKFTTFLQHIFSQVGLTLIGSLVAPVAPLGTSFLARAYILINRFSGQSSSPDSLDQNFVAYSVASTSNLAAESREVIVFATSGQDDNNQFDGTTYTASVPGQHSISLNLYTVSTGTDNPGKYAVQIEVNGVIIQEVTRNVFPGQDPTFFTFSILEIEVSLEVGDTVQVFYARQILIIAFVPFNGQPSRVALGTIKVRGPLNVLGQTVSLNDQMTDVKIVDFLGEMFTAWNLVIEPSEAPASPLEWKLEKSDDYYAAGTLRDWGVGIIDTAQINYKKPTVYREILMKYKESDAAVQQAFRDAAGRNYGELRLNTGVEFGDKILEVKHPCQLIPPALFRVLNEDGDATGQFADVTLHKSINIEGKPVKEDALLFYFNGKKDTAFPYYLQSSNDVSPVGTLQNSYPHIGSVQAFPSTNEEVTLTYSVEAPLSGEAAILTRYYDGWQKLLETQFSANSRVMDRARFILPRIEMIEYRLNDEIFAEGQYYYIQEITHSKDGREAIVTLMSSRKSVPDVRPTVTAGGKSNVPIGASQLQKSAAGVFQKDGVMYAGYIRAQIEPNTGKYLQVVQNITQITINQINAIKGQFRTWDE